MENRIPLLKEESVKENYFSSKGII